MIRRLFRGGKKGAPTGDASFFEVEAGPEEIAERKPWYDDAIDQIRGYGSQKLEEIVERFDSALPFIERAGFSVTEIEVELGVNPKLIPHVQAEEVVEGDERALLMEEVAGRRLISTILSSLFRAADFGRRVDFTGYRFFEIEVEVGVIPSVKVKFMPTRRAVQK